MIIANVDSRNVSIIYDALEVKVLHEVLCHVSTKQLVLASEALMREGFDLSDEDIKTYVGSVLLTEKGLIRSIVAAPQPAPAKADEEEEQEEQQPDVGAVIGEPFEPRNKAVKKKKKETIH